MKAELGPARRSRAGAAPARGRPGEEQQAGRVIVRIATEDQYRLPDEVAERLNELDNAAVAAVEAGDEPRFNAVRRDARLVRTRRAKLDEDELVGSDIILPPPDLTFEEAGGEFTGDGLIPD